MATVARAPPFEKIGQVSVAIRCKHKGRKKYPENKKCLKNFVLFVVFHAILSR